MSLAPQLRYILTVVAFAMVLAAPGLTSSVSAQTPREKIKFELWEAEVPQAVGDAEKDRPSVEVYSLETDQPTPVVVVCPGGGYGGLAMGHEGDQIAAWLNENGVAAVVLNYRHRGKGYGHPVPMLDAQRAIRLTRAHSEDWNLDPTKVGIMGFSAGGHLASTISTHFDSGHPAAEDAVDHQSCRPDFAILCYGVLTMGTEYTHKGSQNNLLGADAPIDLIESMSNEKQVTADTPPTFLFHTDEDSGVLPENSVAFYLALRKHKVPAEMHIFRKGPHGVGLAAKIPGTNQWPDLCVNWMKGLGVLEESQK